MTEQGEVLVQREGAVAWVTVNRPEVRNALSLGVCRRLTGCFRELGAERAARAIVLRGAGEKVFISGADVREFREKLATPRDALAYDALPEELAEAIARAPQPVIALIQGYAVGSGCTVAMACDIRIASDRAKFGIPVAKIGLVPSVPDAARLVSLVGEARAKWLLMTGELIGADEALAAGLVNRVVPFDRLEAAGRETAEMLAANAPITVTSVKQMVDGVVRGRIRTVEDGAPWYQRIFTSRDFQEGIDAFFAKRKPVFRGE